MPVPRQIEFWLNDRRIETRDVAGTTTLLRYLRDHLHLMGTKEGCAEGDCGACSVVVLEEREGASPTFRTVNACLLFLPMLQGRRVYTVEGLREADRLHPAQQALVETRGSQCGYCTPGFVMCLFEATYRDDLDEAWKVDAQLAGNLCRCTGYRPIRDAAHQVAGSRPNDRFLAAMKQYRAKDASLELRAVNGLAGDQLYLQPADLPAFFAARRQHPDAVLLAGGTDLGLAVTKKHEHFRVVIGLEALSELRMIERTDTGWRVGAGVPLTRILETAAEDFPALKKMLRWFGSRQIRNRATVGGNLGTASPIGDLAPVLAALGATLVLTGPKGEREVSVDAFFTGYRQTVLGPEEIILAVQIPYVPPTARCSSFKVSRRREMDISAVSAGMYVDVREGTVHAIRLRYGGMAARAAAPAEHAEKALLGGPWSRDAVEAAMPRVDDDFTPLSDHRASAPYRSTVARNLLLGFFEETQHDERVVDRPVGTADVGGVA